jgi:LuxR family transcriptional regulator, maltose regulon positive regulatory protein
MSSPTTPSSGELDGSHALEGQLTGWRLCTLARLGLAGEARTALAGLDAERAASGEMANARAAIYLAEGDPAAALAAARGVLTGAAPALGYVTLTEASLLAALAHRELGDERSAIAAAESALALAEADRLVPPFVITGSLELLAAMPRHATAHAALLGDIADILRGFSAPPHRDSSRPLGSSARASCECCGICQLICPGGQRSPASSPSRSTRSTPIFGRSTRSSRPRTGPRP